VIEVDPLIDPYWATLLPSYERLIEDESRDSSYLRRVGLLPNVVELLGDCGTTRLLDVGCGSGWLLDTVRVREGYECDCVAQATPKPGRAFSIEDVRSLSYQSEFFDAVVASLVLMWVDKIDQACNELYRVTSVGGRVVVALVHPFSYQTGRVTEKGEFLVTKRYSEECILLNLFISETVGPFRYFHRPLATYINAFCDAGFRLEHMSEWSIDMVDYVRHVPGSVTNPPRTDRVPMYSFFRFRKVK
jgi:SAM-dependent methyltransferase